MTFVGKAWRKALLVSLILAASFAVTRLTFLTTKLPIFTDEAIYIRWSQIGSRDANWRFISLTDGKQPMFTWIMMAFLKFVHDPLLAGRLVSVAAGALSMIGIWVLAHELFKSKRIAWIAAFLYLICPFTLMYDRMALYDSLVATFSIWNLYLAILLVRRVRLDIALILGLTLGAGMLNKTSGFLSLYLLPFTLLLFDVHKENRIKRLFRWVIYVIVAASISQILYSVLRLSPLFHMVSQKDAVFVYPVHEWLTHPLLFLYGNLRGQFDWLKSYLTIPIFIAALAPFFVFDQKWREKLTLYLWWFLPFFALALFGKILYPRFILFMTMPLLVLASYTIDWLWSRYSRVLTRTVLIVVLFYLSIYTDYFIITNPIYAPIPYSDYGQYIHDWPAGWGVAQVNAYLAREGAKGKLAVYTEGTFGLMPAAIEMYAVDNKNIEVHGIWPLPQEISTSIVESTKQKPTYFVLNETQIPPTGWPIVLIAEYQKGLRTDRSLRFYSVDLSLVKKSDKNQKLLR